MAEIYAIPKLLSRASGRLRRCALVAAAMALSCQHSSPSTGAIELAPGVLHHAINLIEGPWAIHIIEIDLPSAWQKGVRLRVARPDSSRPALEKTSILARNAVAAINGDLWYSDSPGRPLGLQISGGALIDEPRRQSAFAITDDGRPLIAVFTAEAGLITASGETLSISMFNRTPGRSALTYYNRFANVAHDSIKAKVGFHLESLGKQSIMNDTVTARVRQVRRHAWRTRLKLGEWLVAAGSQYSQASAISAGDTVRLFYLLHPASDNLQEAIGGGPRILRDGAVSIEYKQEHLGRAPAIDRHPRTAVGYSKDGKTLFLVTVDGRQPGYSVGMTLGELADFMATQLSLFNHSGANAYQALNMDGGGSTTMVVGDHVVNRPSDPTGETKVANALLVVATGRDS